MKLAVGDILDYLTAPAMLPEDTVDKLEYGEADATVTGIGVAFLATQEVIDEAVNLGVNLIITHEDIFYNHRGRRELLGSDPVYLQKRQTIIDNKLAIFRFHDYLHRFEPDGITKGLLHALGWLDYEVKNFPAASILEIPETSLMDAVSYLKKRLGLGFIRYLGDPALSCKRLGVLVGYRGSGELIIPLFEKESLDLVIYGEGPEWETPEYVRDAVRQGRKKALVVLGHAESEMPGMEYLARVLREKFPGIPIHFFPQKSLFQFL
jgi:putative NIF3 family GTP cyclohydrolase 1 type 2